MNSRQKTKQCKFCNSLISNRNTYCSNACQHALKWEETKTKIRGGEFIPNDIRTAKRFVIDSAGHKCNLCGIHEWQNKPVPLVLDHIDGNPTNNKPNNLRVVCGNCDMQLPTYKSKNRGNGRAWRRQRYAEGKSF